MRDLLEGYVGVKYRAIREGAELPPGAERAWRDFHRVGRVLGEHGMSPANGGNMSLAWPGGGFLITSAGSHLGELEPDELAWVLDVRLEPPSVRYRGPREPSSEALLHHLLYRERPGTGAVIHAHDPVGTASRAALRLPVTAREEPYGTLALAQQALATFSTGSPIIVLREHGYVAVGRDLDECLAHILRIHLELVGEG